MLIRGTRCLSVAILLAWTFGHVTMAQPSFESMRLAQSLGDLLASEEPCGLHYDQASIRAFIAKRVRPDDMEFSSNLTLMTAGAGVQMEDMTASAKTAHCAQIARVAKTYGFTQ